MKSICSVFQSRLHSRALTMRFLVHCGTFSERLDDDFKMNVKVYSAKSDPKPSHHAGVSILPHRGMINGRSSCV